MKKFLKIALGALLALCLSFSANGSNASAYETSADNEIAASCNVYGSTDKSVYGNVRYLNFSFTSNNCDHLRYTIYLNYDIYQDHPTVHNGFFYYPEGQQTVAWDLSLMNRNWDRQVRVIMYTSDGQWRILASATILKDGGIIITEDN